MCQRGSHGRCVWAEAHSRPFVITVDSSSLRASQEHCWRTVSKAAGGRKGERWEGMCVGREPAARLSVGAEQDVWSSVRKPADWEPGRAVTDSGGSCSMLLQVETDVKRTSNQKGLNLLVF